MSSNSRKTSAADKVGKQKARSITINEELSDRKSRSDSNAKKNNIINNNKIGSNSVIYEGELFKYRGKFKGWIRQKYVLRGTGDLENYRKDRLQSVRNLASAIVVVPINNPCRFDVDTGRSLLHFRSHNPSDRDAWVSIIKVLQRKIENDGLKDSIFIENFEKLSIHLSKANSLDNILDTKIRDLEMSLDSNNENSLNVDSKDEKKKKKKTIETNHTEFYNAALKLRSEFQKFFNLAKTISENLRYLYEIQDIEESEPQDRANPPLNKFASRGQIIHTNESEESELYFDAEASQVSCDDDDDDDDDYNVVHDEKMAKNHRRSLKPIRNEKRTSVEIKSHFLLPSSVPINSVLNTVPDHYVPRKKLAVSKPKSNGQNIWKILKDGIGKDISKLVLPVCFCEPLSTLQKLAEECISTKLIDQAVSETSSIKRILYITAFALSPYWNVQNRLSKPFNPILGETYELVDKSKKFRFISEQVSHHPPISAYFVEHENWKISSSLLPKDKFWGKSMELYLNGDIHCHLKKYNENYIWQRPTTLINNIILGNRWIEAELTGTVNITNESTNENALLNFKKKGWFDDSSQVVGEVFDSSKNLAYKIEGKWTGSLRAIKVESDGSDSTTEPPLVIWQKEEESLKEYYGFSPEVCKLNELSDWMKPHLSSTDSRYRPDIRLLENGEIDKADEEKTRLENKQRANKAKLEKEGLEWEPLWFRKGEDNEWIYKENYWECRKTGKWPAKTPDIY